MTARVLPFGIRLFGLLLMLVLLDRTPADVIVIILGGALFLLADHRILQANRVLPAIIISLGIVVSFALLMPKQFLQTAYPVVSDLSSDGDVLSLFDLTRGDYELFRKLNELSPQEDIFYASTSAAHSLERFFPIYRDDSLPASAYPAIDRWRISKAPRDLQDAHMAYLLIDDEWQSWLTQAEYDTLIAAENYTLIYESPSQDVPHYYLYEVRSP